MTQFLTAFVPGVLVGGFIGFISAAFIIGGKADAVSQKRTDEEQMEAIAAEAMEKELRLTRQIC